MASTSSSSSTLNYYLYDIFLSFRGDTRFSFTAHLYKALCHAGIRTFRDDNEIYEGQELKLEIEKSITKSKASIIVFSKNYATSSWCLDELWFILEQKRKCKHLVLPVFYGVDPSDVRNQRGCFCIEAKDEAEGSKGTEDNVKRWKAALTKVANLKGMVVSGYETDFIANIVSKICCQLGLKLPSTPIHLNQIKTRAKETNSSFKNKNPIVCSNKQNFESNILPKEVEEEPMLGHRLMDTLENNQMIPDVVFERRLQIEDRRLGLMWQQLRDVTPDVSEKRLQVEKEPDLMLGLMWQKLRDAIPHVSERRLHIEGKPDSRLGLM